MPTYVHCPQCRRAYDAAAGPCEACVIHPEPVDDRLEGTAAAVALCVAGGADIVRVHDVRAMARVVRVADAVARGNWVHRPASS